MGVHAWFSIDRFKTVTKRCMPLQAGPALTLGRLGKWLGPPVRGAAKLLLHNYSLLINTPA